jgi:hypothetical protein
VPFPPADPPNAACLETCALPRGDPRP